MTKNLLPCAVLFVLYTLFSNNELPAEIDINGQIGDLNVSLIYDPVSGCLHLDSADTVIHQVFIESESGLLFYRDHNGACNTNIFNRCTAWFHASAVSPRTQHLYYSPFLHPPNFEKEKLGADLHAFVYIGDELNVNDWRTLDLVYLSPGDFNVNGLIDVEDINLLQAEILHGTNSKKFDLNFDGQVDRLDLSFWVHDSANTFFGDANLDGEFNSRDLVAVFETGEYEDRIVGNSTWADGDWNSDGEFNSRDFVLAIADGGYEVDPRQATHHVPEPSAATFVGLGTILACLALGKSRNRTA